MYEQVLQLLSGSVESGEPVVFMSRVVRQGARAGGIAVAIAVGVIVVAGPRRWEGLLVCHCNGGQWSGGTVRRKTKHT